MRLFIAILPDGGGRNALRAAQNELRRHGVDGNYTRGDNLHLTLAFIGDYPEPDAVLDAMGALRAGPVSIRLGELGAFGDTWWAGADGGEELERLVSRLRRLLSDAAIPFDRKRFVPHITLIRRAELHRGARPDQVCLPETEMTAERVSLMLSTKGKHGMIYSELGSVQLL